MKQVLLISFICLMSLSGLWSQSRPDDVVLTYSAYNKPLKLVLTELSNISKVNIVYSDSRIPKNRQINISAKNEKLGSILTVILSEFNIKYQIIGNQLVLEKTNITSIEKEATIYGYIKDKVSGEVLIGANVFVHDRSNGTNTNEYGYYSLKLPRETYRLHFSYLGYKSEILEFFVDKDTIVNVTLEPDGLLNEIVIMNDLLEEEQENTASKQNLHIDKILSSNHLVGEADLFRFIGMQAGVSTGADGIGGLNVWGGSADQNLVLLDGVPIYNTGHALGIFSIFNSNTIKSASFYKGGIPARYSGRLSSIIDVHTKDGNYNKLSGDITLSTIALKGTLEGPMFNNKNSFIVSFRRTFVDIWIKQFTKYQNSDKDKQGYANYYFQDFNGKLNFSLGKRSKLLLSVFQSKDDYKNNTTGGFNTLLRDENSQQINWGNRSYSIRLNTEINKKLFSKLSIYQTEYDFTSYRNNLFETAVDSSIFFDAYLFESSIKELGLRQDFDWVPNPTHFVKFGVAVQKRNFSPRVTSISDADFNPPITKVNIDTLQKISEKNTLKGDEINAFVEDEIKIGDGITINGGLNYSIIFAEKDKKYKSFQPRMAILANSDLIHFKFGISHMQQYLHLLSNNGLGLPTDVWIPTSDILPPQKSWIFNTSFGYRLNNGFKFGAEAYYKLFNNISNYQEGGQLDINNAVDWQSLVPIGKGTAYGLEGYVEKVVGKTLFSVNYTYSISNRDFKDLNNGRKFDFGLNRTHSFKASFTHRLSDFSEFLLNWSYTSGSKFSQPINISVLINGQPVIIYPEKNNAIFPAYHRLDVGFSFYNAFKWGRAKFFLGLYNAYNRSNPFYTELVRSQIDRNKYEFKQFSLLPFLPTISYSISF